MSAETFPSLNPPSWPATLTRVGLWIVAMGMVLVLASGPSHRIGALGFRPALIALGVGTLIAASGALLTALGLVSGAVKSAPVPRAAGAIAIVIALANLGYLLSWMTQMRGTAMIHEVSTDLDNPPPFVELKQVRERTPGVNPTEYVAQIQGRSGPIDVPAQQRKYYPDIQSLTLDVTPEEAYARARRAIERLGWEIAAESPEDGRIEATDTTRFFGFRDDIVVRIQPAAGGVRVDVRSKSRVGLGDAGVNAKRVRRFLELMQSA
ncbi:MAG TPA: DUF1499 domain-containing protein [Steroidobacteraceae bacterium]|nr:DUF1499 domain-containing protein [Steroidobacteraceae bacterium]